MKRKLVMAIMMIAVVLYAAACSREGVQNEPATRRESTGGSHEATIEEAYDFPAAYMIESDNYIDYQDGMQCAAFSSAYILRHFGEQADGMEIFEDFPNKAPDGGIFPDGIVNYLEGKGYQAEFKQDGTVEELKYHVSQGTPVIVFIHTEEPYESVHYTHYIPMIGYNEEYLYFAESIPGLANCEEEQAIYNRKTDIAKFKRLWLNIDGVWDNPYFVIAKPPVENNLP